LAGCNSAVARRCSANINALFRAPPLPQKQATARPAHLAGVDALHLAQQFIQRGAALQLPRLHRQRARLDHPAATATVVAACSCRQAGFDKARREAGRDHATRAAAAAQKLKAGGQLDCVGGQRRASQRVHRVCKTARQTHRVFRRADGDSRGRVSASAALNQAQHSPAALLCGMHCSSLQAAACTLFAF